MKTNLPLKTLLLLASALLLPACTSVSIKQYAVGTPPPLCREQAPREKLIVYWGTAWRADQKEIPFRDRIAAREIEAFFRQDPCYELLDIATRVDQTKVLLVEESRVIEAARRQGADRLLLIRLEELGPNLMVYLSPILWQTKNEVLVRVRSLDVGSGEIESDVTIHWMRGGPFTAHGAKELPIDLRGALHSIVSGRDGG